MGHCGLKGAAVGRIKSTVGGQDLAGAEECGKKFIGVAYVVGAQGPAVVVRVEAHSPGENAPYQWIIDSADVFMLANYYAWLS